MNTSNCFYLHYINCECIKQIKTETFPTGLKTMIQHFIFYMRWVLNINKILVENRSMERDMLCDY